MKPQDEPESTLPTDRLKDNTERERIAPASNASPSPESGEAVERPFWAPELNPDGSWKIDYTDLNPSGEEDAVSANSDAAKTENADLPQEHVKASARMSVNGEPRFILPGGDVTDTQAGEVFFQEFGKNEQLFLQGDRVVEVDVDPNTDTAKLLPVYASALRSRVNLLGPLYAWRKRGDAFVLARAARCTEETARALIQTRAVRTYLKRISLLANCPIITQDEDGEIQILGKGYHPLLGGVYVTRGRRPPQVPLKEAIRAIARAFEDFKFANFCSQMRAWANVITPALKLGGLLRGHAPIQYAESLKVNSGKSFLQDLTPAFYDETPYLAPLRPRGVGGLDESIASGLAYGRQFIKIDNLEGEWDSQYLASITTHNLAPARTPYRREFEVDVTRRVFCINGVTAELSAHIKRRLSIVRLRQRPLEFDYVRYREGDVLAHVKAHSSYYLGCIFSIVRAWVEAGKPRTNERRHSLTDWAQSLDWIMLHICKTVCPMFDDYDSHGEPCPVIERSDYLTAADDIFIMGGSS
jgi:hypothetical protein